MVAFVDEIVGRHRHDQQISELPCLIEVADVSQMKQIENAVAKNDPLTIRRHFSKGGLENIEREYFALIIQPDRLLRRLHE